MYNPPNCLRRSRYWASCLRTLIRKGRRQMFDVAGVPGPSLRALNLGVTSVLPFSHRQPEFLEFLRPNLGARTVAAGCADNRCDVGEAY